MSKESSWLYFVLVACLFTFSCASNGNSGAQWPGISGSSQEIPPPPPTPTDIVLVDGLEVLEDGAGWIYKLGEGRYELQMTASNDGATVEWIGGTCGRSEPWRSITMTCSMQGTGQLVIRNPTVFGLGKSTSVTIKLTKLAY